MGKQVISFHYELKDDKGTLIDSSQGNEPLAFLEGNGSIIPKLEEVLLLLPKGERKDVSIAYQDGYGAYDNSLIAKVARKQFPTPNLKEGDVFQVQKGDGVQMVVVIEISDDEVTVDANHPLAGKNLSFVVEITDKRDATADEIAHGHAHTPGHDHHHH